MYQNGLVRVTPKADATGNRVGIAVTQPAVIPNPEEICPEMCPRILGPALMTATPCAFVGNAPEYSRVSFALDHTIADRCRVEETDKAPESSDTLPLRESLCLVLLGRMFTSGSTYPVACAARQSNPLAFIIARKQWNLSEAEEYNETSRADGRGGHHSFRRPSYAVTVGHKRL